MVPEHSSLVMKCCRVYPSNSIFSSSHGNARALDMDIQLLSARAQSEKLPCPPM